MNLEVRNMLETATIESVRKWLHDRCALLCWCSDDAAEQLPLSVTDRTCLENERKSLLEVIHAMESGHTDACAVYIYIYTCVYIYIYVCVYNSNDA
jgi:hypothetical protein